MLNLTKKEQKVLALVMFLLLIGLAARTYRTASSDGRERAVEAKEPANTAGP